MIDWLVKTTKHITLLRAIHPRYLEGKTTIPKLCSVGLCRNSLGNSNYTLSTFQDEQKQDTNITTVKHYICFPHVAFSQRDGSVQLLLFLAVSYPVTYLRYQNTRCLWVWQKISHCSVQSAKRNGYHWLKCSHLLTYKFDKRARTQPHGFGLGSSRLQVRFGSS